MLAGLSGEGCSVLHGVSQGRWMGTRLLDSPLPPTKRALALPGAYRLGFLTVGEPGI